MHNHCVCMYMYMYKNIFWVLRLRDQPFCFIVRLICECAGGVCGGGVTRLYTWKQVTSPFYFPGSKDFSHSEPHFMEVRDWSRSDVEVLTSILCNNSQKYFAMFHALWMCYANNFSFWKNFSRCFDCNDEGKLKFWGENGETNLIFLRNLT